MGAVYVCNGVQACHQQPVLFLTKCHVDTAARIPPSVDILRTGKHQQLRCSREQYSLRVIEKVRSPMSALKCLHKRPVLFRGT